MSLLIASLALGSYVVLNPVHAAGGAGKGLSPGGANEQASKPAESPPSTPAAGVVRLTNLFRTQQGRTALLPSAQLAAAAQDFAAFMARTDQYGHNADGNEPSARAEQHGYAFCIVAENIGYQYRSGGLPEEQRAETFVEEWKNSPPHRHNMLDHDVTDIGVGLARSDKSGRWYGVQMFGLPASASHTFRITNTSDSRVSYRLGGRTFDLAPRVTRTHENCGPEQLKFDRPRGEAVTLRPEAGQGLVIETDGSGGWRLQRK
ncbi:MAG: CAP domain-containing protein [Casimicrobiaceae bacterium]